MKLRFHRLFSNFAFIFNLRRYNTALAVRAWQTLPATSSNVFYTLIY